MDAVVSNPPYRKCGSGMKQENRSIAIARHEIAVKLSEVCDAAAYLLSSGGKFFVINQTERLAETMYECKNANWSRKTPDTDS